MAIHSARGKIISGIILIILGAMFIAIGLSGIIGCAHTQEIPTEPSCERTKYVAKQYLKEATDAFNDKRIEEFSYTITSIECLDRDQALVCMITTIKSAGVPQVCAKAEVRAIITVDLEGKVVDNIAEVLHMMVYECD